MAQTFVQLPDDSANTGKKEDHFTTSGTGNYREAVTIASPTTDAAVAAVLNASPASSDYGVVVRDYFTAILGAQVLDYDSGAGTANTAIIGIALPASGGPVAGGTSSNPIRIDPTGSTTQPVSGTVTANIGTSGSLALDASITTFTKAEDAAHSSGDKGIMALAVRNATATDLSAGNTDGDYEPLQVSATGRLWVDPSGVTLTVASHAVTNAGTFVVQENGSWIQADDAAFSPATSKVAMIGATFDDVAPDSIDEGDGGAIRMSANRNLYTTIRDAAGNERGVNINASNQLAVAGPVTNAGTFVVQENGAALTSLQLIDDVVYAEDVASSGSDKGIAILAVRRDANTTMVDTTGDYANLQVDATGSLKVAIISGAGSGGTALADNAAFTPGTTNFTPIGGEVDDTGTTDAIENSAAAVRMTVKRAIHVNLRDASGNELSVGGGTQYTEDAASASDPVGTMVMAVRRDSLSASEVSADGDNIVIKATSKGQLHVALADAITVNSHAVTNAGTFAVQATIASGAAAIAKAEDVASADADVGVPAMAIRKATPANTSGTDGDYEMLQMSAGRLWVDGSGVTLTVAAHAVTNAGTFVVQENGAALTSLQLIDDPVIADDSAFTPATSKVMMAGFEADESSTDSVDEGDAGAARMTLDRKQIVTVQPHTAGGLSTFMASGSDGSTALTGTAQVIKASAGQVYGYYIYNPNTSAQYVHFYNTAAGSVTVGTTNPLFTLTIPAQAAANLTGANGIAFTNAGFSMAATSTAGGAGNPTTALDAVVWYA